MKYKVSQYAKKYGVTIRTVWNWMYSNKVKYERDSTNHIRIIEEENAIQNNNVAVYARVASSENKDNLLRQQKRLEEYCTAKGYNIIKSVAEVGSGLNYIKLLLNMQGRDIEIVNKASDSGEEDIIQDFVSIITSFCARLYGKMVSKRKTEQILQELKTN